MPTNMKLFRNASQSHRFPFMVLVIGCFLVSTTFILISRPLAFPSFGSKLSSDHPQNSEKNKEDNLQGKKNYTVTDTIKEDKTEIDEVMETTVEIEDETTKKDDNSDQDEPHNRMTLPTFSNYPINDNLQVENKSNPEQQSPVEIKNVEKKLACEFSDPRVDICEMSGDIRIPGNSSEIIFVESQEKNQVFRLRPYARKGDEAAFSRVRELAVKSTAAAPQCTVRHNVPAIVFSAGGYTGNLFHDFTDVLIPLFVTARQFDGEVQFVVSDMNPWWIFKYLLVFQKLSKYPVINFDKDKEVHCFSKVTVGLRAHMELSIDPSRAPHGYSMVDFGNFLRSALNLERESISNIEDLAGRRPRILIVARKKSRAFVNLYEIAQLADQLGFEVIVDEAEAADVPKFAKLVNSVDVLLAAHGAGLTNLVFLPPNATVIHVVPLGGLEWMATMEFGYPAKDMKLDYVQYSISVEESSLIEQYPRDHPVFKDPFSFQKQGLGVMRSVFMDKQNVKLDIKKFKNVLWKALEHIIQ
ncbi:hypothetical protein Cni_G06479 [Canna indica]|uniref:Glycosyltransferase 61 catalytic domain-containing protein n=1 Tax=Canna indica TaxID=4628 RepID=A0AAQ3JX14_9LILI|nr:hypothetical protein Cni_G06479 [Canna indica]